MRKITRSVIKLSEIPEELQKSKALLGHKEHTYAEFHLFKDDHSPLGLWLLKTYPTLSRKISFLIHIDK